jgi:hypothetical protein
VTPGPGHNVGPPLDEPDSDGGWGHWIWRKKHKAAWKTPPREIALRRLARAEELGMSYKPCAIEIMDAWVEDRRGVPMARGA